MRHARRSGPRAARHGRTSRIEPKEANTTRPCHLSHVYPSGAPSSFAPSRDDLYGGLYSGANGQTSRESGSSNAPHLRSTATVNVEPSVLIGDRSDRLTTPGVISRVGELLELKYRSVDRVNIDGSLDVDTHARRVLERLGLVDVHPVEPTHRDVERLASKKLRRRLHINLMYHGREVCRSQQPQCERCVLVSFCPVGQKAVVEGSARPDAVELFAGGGGLGEGFRRAGYRLAVAVERGRDPAQTYRLNHPGTSVLEADVNVLDETDLLRLAPGLQDVAVLLAGPPCQGYSAAGRRDPDDPANRLYEEVARFAKLLQPEMVVLENVTGLRRVNGVNFTQPIRKAIRDAGYTVSEPAQLKASHFGVSQNRTRLFYLARREDLGPAPTPPRSTHAAPDEHPPPLGSGVTQMTPRLEDVLSGLPDLGPGVDLEHGFDDGRPIYNASTMAHSQRVVDKISKIGPGEGPISYRRLDREIARTLVAGHRALPVHPRLDRTISVREAARIQGFADDYVFAGARSNQPLQVANAVPPPVAEAIARHLLDYLSERWGRTHAGRRNLER